MKKFYRLVSILFVLTVLALGVLAILYQKQIRAYLGNLNNLSGNELSIVRPKATPFSTSSNLINLDIALNSKFLRLKKTEVDTTNFKLPEFPSSATSSATSSLFATGTAIIGQHPTTTASTSEFKVGNPDPFKPF